MACNLCEGLLLPNDEAGVVYFTSMALELRDKMNNVLSNLGYLPIMTNGSVKCETDNVLDFFKNIANSSHLNSLESANINVLILGMLEQPTFETFYKAKPLKTILSLVKNGSFIDILRFESFTIHFQPIIDKNNNSIFGYESLLRGINPFTNELVSPAFLFDSAREYNMLFFLDRFARELALKSAAVKNIDSHLFINFLPTSIYDPVHCLQSTVKWANQLEFNPKNIVFEVVETEKVEDPIHLKNILDYYKSQGFKTALDDVGSGYSSLSMLASLNPDIIKIDREIIIDIDKNNVKQSICKALVSMANDSGITVLAEGIETRGEYEYLSTLKIDLMQGFFFGKPQAEPLRVLKI